VTDLLSLSRNRTADRDRVEASQLIAEVVDRYPAPENVIVTINLPADLSTLFVDGQQIRQVLGNLVTNAYQAMPEGGQLFITAQSEADQVKFSITDTGSGMSNETLQKIFEPLYTTKTKGVGLGLAVSRNLTAINDGHLEVESIEGQGSTFTLYVPTSSSG